MDGFITYQKTVGGRRHDRYFKHWENAKQALLNDAEDAKRAGWSVTETLDYFYRDKGFYVYEIHGITKAGEQFRLSLIDCYFED